jgi:hypothetical protein
MPDLTTRAEEAFLGAIISDARQLGDLQVLRDDPASPPLHARLFTDPACRALWTAVSRLSEIAPGARGPQMADLILTTSNHPLITHDYLTQLALSTPTPTAALVYLRMISEAALFRAIAASGLPAGDGGAWPDRTTAGILTSHAANLTTAWSADYDTATPGPPPQHERAIREERFLAGLIGQQELTDWITVSPAILTAPGLREIYQATVHVDRLGEPADAMTITWTAARTIAENDTIDGRNTTPRSLAETIPPGTITRLATTRTDPLAALEAGRGLLADHARAQIDARAAATRSAERDLDTGHHGPQASSRSRPLDSQDTPPLLRPPDHQPRYGPRLSQEGD